MIAWVARLSGGTGPSRPRARAGLSGSSRKNVARLAAHPAALLVLGAGSSGSRDGHGP